MPNIGALKQLKWFKFTTQFYIYVNIFVILKTGVTLLNGLNVGVKLFFLNEEGDDHCILWEYFESLSTLPSGFHGLISKWVSLLLKIVHGTIVETNKYLAGWLTVAVRLLQTACVLSFLSLQAKFNHNRRWSREFWTSLTPICLGIKVVTTNFSNGKFLPG